MTESGKKIDTEKKRSSICCMRTPETLPQTSIEIKKSDSVSRREMLLSGTRALIGAALAPAAANAQDWMMSRYSKTRTSARAPAPKPESLGRRSLRTLDKADETLREVFLSLQARNDIPRVRAAMEAEFTSLDKEQLDIGEYLKRDIDLMTRHNHEPVRSVMLDSLCVLQQWSGAPDMLHKTPAHYEMGQGEANWEIRPVGLCNSRRNLSFAVTQADQSSGTEKMKTVSYAELASAIVRRDCEQILRSADDAWHKEQQGRNRLRAFDVPRTGRVVVLQVIAADGDPVMAASLLHTYLFMRMLRQRNPLTEHRIVLTSIPQVDVPLALDDIKHQARARHERPPYCIQDYNCHGSDTALQFRRPLTPQQIWLMQFRYGGPGHVQSLACYEGGLRKEDELLPLTTFTHTDAQSWNCLALRDGTEHELLPSDARGSPFSIFLLEELSRNPKATFGEAVAAADEKTKKIARLNPGATINGVRTE